MADPESDAVREFAEKNAHSGEIAPQGAASGAEDAAVDPHLQFILERWSHLSKTMKVDVVAMVRGQAIGDAPIWVTSQP